MKNAVILTGNKYPKGDAGALRQHMISKMLQQLGYSVMIYSMGETTSKTVKELDGVRYMSMRGTKTGLPARLSDRATWGFRALKDMEKRFDRVDALFLIDDNPLLFRKAGKYAAKNKCALIHDCVEWYSPEEYKTGRFNMQYMLKDYVNRHSIDQNWSVIAISTYLLEWFRGRVQKETLIPVILDMADVEEIPADEKGEGVTRFVYAGAPGRKDYLREMIDGFSLVSPEKLAKIELHILGVNREQLLTDCGADEKAVGRLGASLHVHGRVPHDEAVRWVKNADYTLLLRDPGLRYAKAGFPTKIVESLKYGTPPMCNLSSDLADYLQDEVNAVIVKGYDARAVRAAVERAAALPEEKHQELRVRARETAVEYFDYHKYIGKLEELLKADA